ncbi:D-alanyl-D-alanine carboxypeptidase [bacterium]|nr:D-alanyl-D-alanine carboxypeptidase [bacterium]
MISAFLNLYAILSLGTSSFPTVSYSNMLPASEIPLKQEYAVAPIIDAKAAIITDFDSGAVLFEKNGNAKLQIASITKLMTVILALENGNLNDTVTVSNKAAVTEGSKIWLLKGEKISLGNLIQGTLIHSGNDAAIAIAEHISGDTKTFVNMMNEKAKKLGLYSTHYENPIGFDSIQNYSTVKDLSLLARYVYRKKFVKDTAKIKSKTIASIDGKITHDVTTTDKLLDSSLNVLGLKTGHTEGAGLCFISIIENGKGNKIITIVLDSPARFEETKKLASWAFRSYIW